MYDELVKALRICVDKDKDCFDCPYYSKCMSNDSEKHVAMVDAADAIEELLPFKKQVEKGMGLLDKADELLNAVKPRWIPVKERLPKTERKFYWICTDTGYQCECRWTNNRFGFGIRELDKWGWSIFDIPQYQKVVAWMPLPCPYEPPKEE